jgi:hypothetical protein
VEVLEFKGAIAELSNIVKAAANGDSSERITSGDYQQIINSLEEMLAEVQAPFIDEEKLTALYKEVQRLLNLVARRTEERLRAMAQSVSTGGLSDEILRTQSNFAAASAIIGDLCKQIVAAADSRAAEIDAAIQGSDSVAVDSTQPTDDHAPMTDLSRQELKAELSASEAKVDARLANFDSSIKTGFAELATAMARQAAAMEKQTDALRIELAKQSGDLRTEMANGRADATKQNSDSMRWIILAVFTMVSISVAIIGVMINLNRSEKAPAAQPAPIVITVPAPAPSPSQSPPAR